MKLRIITIAYQLLIISTLFFLAGCGGGGGTAISSGSGTGAITAKVVAASTVKSASAQKTDVATLPGVVTVRFSVSGPSMTTISKVFPVDDRRGTVDGVPAGTGRMLTVQGLNSSGVVIYGGNITNITVTEGQTSDIGTVTLQPVTSTTGFTTDMVAGKTTSNPATWNGAPSLNTKVWNSNGTWTQTTALVSAPNTVVATSSGTWSINSTGQLIGTTTAASYSTTLNVPSTATLVSSTSTALTADINGTQYVFTYVSTGDNTATGSSAYFPATVGNSWTYETTGSDSSPFTATYAVSQVSGSTFTLRFSHTLSDATGNGTYTSDQHVSILNGGYYVTSSNSTGNGISSGITYTSTSQTTYSAPGNMFLPPSMTIGASVSSSSTGNTSETTTTSGSSSGSYTTTATTTQTFNYSVAGTESVTVPAGTFSAVKLNYTQTTTTVTSTPYSQTVTMSSSGSFWYVSGIGWVKSVDTTSGNTSTTVLKSYVIK